MKRIRLGALIGTACILTVTPLSATAEPGDTDDPDSSEPTFEIRQGLIPAEPLTDLGGMEEAELPPEADSHIPDNVLALMEDIRWTWDEDTLNGVEWWPEKQTVEVWVSPHADAKDVSAILALDDRIDVMKGEYSQTEFREVAHRLSGTEIGGATIWAVGPRSDYSGINVYAEPGPEQPAPQSQSDREYSTVIDGIEATVHLEAKPELAAG